MPVSICVIDVKPRRLNEAQREAMTTIADATTSQIFTLYSSVSLGTWLWKDNHVDRRRRLPVRHHRARIRVQNELKVLVRLHAFNAGSPPVQLSVQNGNHCFSSIISAFSIAAPEAVLSNTHQLFGASRFENAFISSSA